MKILHSKALAGIGFVAILLGVYMLLPDTTEARLLRLVNALDWPVTVLILAFFFQRVLTYLFFSLDSFNFFGASGTLRPIEDVIEEQTARRIREREDREEKERLLNEYNDVPQEIVEYMNAQEETINELRSELADASRERYIQHLAEETKRREGE